MDNQYKQDKTRKARTTLEDGHFNDFSSMLTERYWFALLEKNYWKSSEIGSFGNEERKNGQYY